MLLFLHLLSGHPCYADACFRCADVASMLQGGSFDAGDKGDAGEIELSLRLASTGYAVRSSAVCGTALQTTTLPLHAEPIPLLLACTYCCINISACISDSITRMHPYIYIHIFARSHHTCTHAHMHTCTHALITTRAHMHLAVRCSFVIAGALSEQRWCQSTTG